MGVTADTSQQDPTDATGTVSWLPLVALALILVMTPKVADVARTGPAPRLDLVGTVLSASGLGLLVLGAAWRRRRWRPAC